MSLFQVTHNGQKFADLPVPMPGRHNALNALAALVAAHEAGLGVTEAVDGIKNFQGVDRRFQSKGEVNGILFYDDYGHHPTEVRAVLEAFKNRYPKRRLVVYFQPHRYSRTESCWQEFLSCFGHADQLYISDIYPAGENPIDGIHSEIFCAELDHPDCVYCPDLDGSVAQIASDLRPNDVFVTLGAGHIWRTGEAIQKQVEEHHENS